MKKIIFGIIILTTLITIFIFSVILAGLFVWAWNQIL
jgi:hypothetical protein